MIFLLKVISLWPFWFLYFVSDILYFLIYFVFGYRKKVVRKNLEKSFPNKPIKELRRIEKNFYSYLCDLIMETIKVPKMNIKELHKRCEINDIEDYLSFYKSGKSFIVVLGHQGNYEWANLSFASRDKLNFYGIFHPMTNEIINDYFIGTRAKFGTKLIPMREALNILRNDESTKNAIWGFVADQSPRPTNAYWTTFLNQETGFYWGVERTAKEYNLPVVFVDIKRVSRGYYTIFPEFLVQNPMKYKDGEITELFVRKLETKILEQPETWFWSHKRWKHNKPQ